MRFSSGVEHLKMRHSGDADSRFFFHCKEVVVGSSPTGAIRQFIVCEGEEPMHFEDIKAYLGRMRNAEYKILTETDSMLQFEVMTKYTDPGSGRVYTTGIKLFTVHFRNGSIGDSLDGERPRYHHYYLQFEQEDVPSRGGRLCTVSEWKWYWDEEDVLYRIKALKNRYHY